MILKQSTLIEPSDRPPSFGELQLAFLLPPVSMQASEKVKAEFRDEVQQVTKTAGYLFSGDVQLEIEWMVHERKRYESDRSPDLDNIIKPLMDAICGPEGLLIDDNQVQRISCSWIDWTSEEEQLRVCLKFIPDEWIPKKNLRFVQIDGALCMPISGTFQPEVQLKLFDTFEMMLSSRDNLTRMGLDYYDAKAVMPIQRIFHRTRIRDFPVMTKEEFRESLTRS